MRWPLRFPWTPKAYSWLSAGNHVIRGKLEGSQLDVGNSEFGGERLSLCSTTSSFRTNGSF